MKKIIFFVLSLLFNGFLNVVDGVFKIDFFFLSMVEDSVFLNYFNL